MHTPSSRLLGTWLWVCLLIVPAELALLESPSVAAGTVLPQRPSQNLRPLAMTLGNKTILAKVAENDSARIQGLLGWTSINDETGMLLDFIFEGNYAIHMQGM